MYDATFDYEVWKDIPSYVGYYQASDMGRIRSVHRLVPSCIAEGLRIPKRVLKPGHNAQGRLQVVLCAGGVTKRYQVHRLVYEAFYGFVRGELYVLHRDGNHLNNAPDNLYAGTQMQNMQDKIAHGRQQRGEFHPHVKLTAEIVTAIRASNLKQSELAFLYGVTQAAISNIKALRTWKHLPDVDLFGAGI